MPEDLVAWLQANPRLSVQNPTPVTVGGLDGVALDIRVIDSLTDPPGECTSRACVVLATVAGSDEAVDIERGQLARLVILGEPGHQLVLLYRAPERQFPALDQAVDRPAGGPSIRRVLTPHLYAVGSRNDGSRV